MSSRKVVSRRSAKKTVKPVVTLYPKTSKSHYLLEVIKKEQDGITCFSGSMSVAQFVALSKVDNYNSHRIDDEKGYQRKLDIRRGIAFGNFIEIKSNNSVAEVMLNDRNGEFVTFFPSSIKVFGEKSMTGVLKIPANAVLWVYDGQTRRYGYIYLLDKYLNNGDEDAYEYCKNIKVYFSLIQVDLDKEHQYFLDFNGKQASVPQTHISETSGIKYFDTKLKDIDCSNIEKKKMITAITCRMLNDNKDCTWHNQIFMSDTQEKCSEMVNIGSFNTGLDRVIPWMMMNHWGTKDNSSQEFTVCEVSQDLANTLTVFWKAIRNICPKISKNQEDYVMTSSKGITILCRLITFLFDDFQQIKKDWNVINLQQELKRSKIITTPLNWVKKGDIDKAGGSFSILDQYVTKIYNQIRSR